MYYKFKWRKNMVIINIGNIKNISLSKMLIIFASISAVIYFEEYRVMIILSVGMIGIILYLKNPIKKFFKNKRFKW